MIGWTDKGFIDTGVAAAALAAMLSFAIAGSATAQGIALAGIQSLDSIQAAAEKAVRLQLPDTRAKYFVTPQRMDSRLRLAACADPLEAFIANNAAPAARSTVGVRCPAQNTWTVYVPVSVEVEAPILVLRRALARRSPVEPIDVELQTRRLPGMASGFISDLGSLPGRRLKRALPAGTALTADVLVPDVLVKRGQQVTLLAMSGTIEIRAQGQALSEGGANDRIRVQNINSMKIVEGVVENSGTVRVAF
jgi:flagella basal body P-ring formation protein FlgA